MRKIAIFTEGQSELIFSRQLLHLIFGYEKVSFDCFKLHAGTMHSVPHSYRTPNAELYVLLVDVSNDAKVLSAIKEREQRLFNSGYNEVLAVRDMYSKEYCSFSSSVDEKTVKDFIEKHQSTIGSFQNAGQIYLFFAIMEFEAWLLSMYKLFEKINPTLTVEYIEAHLGFNLRDINPQNEFFHPAVQVGQIFDLVGVNYNKSKDQMEGIHSHIDQHDIDNALENGKCESFKSYWLKIRDCIS